jgi:hypothetical protein
MTAAEPKARRPAYPPEIKEAVKLAVAARGTRNGAPGPKQNVLVRKALGDSVSDPKAILKAAGVRTEKALRAIADGTAPKSDLAALHPLAKQIDEQFCRGRWLAAMLVAAVEQAKR